jgi:hypothetical protein
MSSSKTPSKKKHGRDSIPKKFREQYDAELEEAMKKFEKEFDAKNWNDTLIMQNAASQNSLSTWSPELTREQFKNDFLTKFKLDRGLIKLPKPPSTQNKTNKNKPKKSDLLSRFTSRLSQLSSRFSRKKPAPKLAPIHEE